MGSTSRSFARKSVYMAGADLCEGVLVARNKQQQQISCCLSPAGLQLPGLTTRKTIQDLLSEIWINLNLIMQCKVCIVQHFLFDSAKWVNILYYNHRTV